VDGLVDRIIDELEDLYPDSGEVTVIATGGLAPLVLGISESIEFHEPDLTLIGLRLVYERN
jgi:type III pantothenate kinase